MENTQELGIGWLYVVTHPNAAGLVKIGITDRPERRMEELDNPQVLARVPVRRPARHEKRLHQKFQAKRVPQTEWFALAEEELDELFDHLEDLARPFLDLIVLPGTAEPGPLGRAEQLRRKLGLEPEPKPEPPASTSSQTTRPSSTKREITMAELIDRYGLQKAMRIDEALKRANKDPEWRAEMLRDHGLA